MAKAAASRRSMPLAASPGAPDGPCPQVKHFIKRSLRKVLHYPKNGYRPLRSGSFNPSMEMQAGGSDGKTRFVSYPQGRIVVGQGAHSHVLCTLLGHPLESCPIQASPQASILSIWSYADEVEAPRLLAHYSAEGLIDLADDESLDGTATAGHQGGKLRMIKAAIHQLPIKGARLPRLEQGVAGEPVVNMGGFDYSQDLFTVGRAAYRDLNVCRRLNRLIQLSEAGSLQGLSCIHVIHRDAAIQKINLIEFLYDVAQQTRPHQRPF
jgi:hypothetical protein